jgi:hypothetical protein
MYVFFSIAKLFSVLQVPGMKIVLFKILVIESETEYENGKKNYVPDPNPKKMNSTTLLFQAVNKEKGRRQRAAELPANFEGSLQLRMRNAATGSRAAQLRPTAFTATECAVTFHNQLGNPGIFVITGTGM